MADTEKTKRPRSTTTQDTKTPPAKPRKRAAARTAAPTGVLTAEERRRLVAEAAYLRAERRGFVGGDPVQDWLEAEAEIDSALLTRTAKGTRKGKTRTRRDS